jgi:predicted Zn-dependent peptidase
MVYGRPMPMSEIVARVEAVDEAQVASVARRLASGRLSVAAIGPIDRVEPYETISGRLA